MTGKTISVIGLIAALAGIVWGAAAAWTSLTDRVSALEHQQRYFHGTMDVSKEKE